MATFGDVLRGYASVLNPQVAAEQAKEDEQQKALQNQMGMAVFQNQLRQQDPAYQAQVEALKNERDFRQAASQAGGDVTKLAAAAVQYGKPELAVNLYNQQEARAARLQQAKDALQARQDALQMQMEQKNLDREQRAQAAQMMADLKAQSIQLQGEIARGNQQLRSMQFQMQGNQQTVKQTQQLGAALEKANLPQADAVLADVETAFRKNPAISEYVAGPKSMLPDWMVPDDAKFARQAFQKLFNITLKDRSGAAVTNQELERLKSEFAAGAFKTTAQLQNAVERARNIINKHYAGIAGGFSKETLNAYNENVRGLGGRVVLEAPGADSGGGSGSGAPSVVDFGDLK